MWQIDMPLPQTLTTYESGSFVHGVGVQDAPQPVTNARDFCCEKTCGFYVDP